MGTSYVLVDKQDVSRGPYFKNVPDALLHAYLYFEAEEFVRVISVTSKIETTVYMPKDKK